MRAITIPPTPSPPPTMPIPRRSSTLPLARWSPSCMVAPRVPAYAKAIARTAKSFTTSRHAWAAARPCPLDALAQPEEPQDSDDDDDCADDVDDVVHEILFRVRWRIESITCTLLGPDPPYASAHKVR